MYESTWTVLLHLYTYVSVGGFVVIDDLGLKGTKEAIGDFRGCVGSKEPITLLVGPEYKVCVLPTCRSLLPACHIVLPTSYFLPHRTSYLLLLTSPVY